MRIDGEGKGTEIDEPTAEAIRAKTDTELSDKEVIYATVDGVIRSSHTVKLLLQDGTFINTECRDPTFDVEPNIYIKALDNGETLKTTIRTASRDGQIFKIYLLEAE